jgi:hypothetical protein
MPAASSLHGSAPTAETETGAVRLDPPRSRRRLAQSPAHRREPGSSGCHTVGLAPERPNQSATKRAAVPMEFSSRGGFPPRPAPTTAAEEAEHRSASFRETVSLAK